MLYKPWRNEWDEVESQNCEALYLQIHDAIDNKSKDFNALDFDPQEIMRELEEQRNMEDNDDDEDDATQNNINFMPLYDYDENMFRPNVMADIGEDVSTKDSIKTFTVPDQMNNDEYYKLCDSLNVKQRDYLMHVTSEFKLKNLPVHHFITGKAGVGKSRLISAIYQTILRIYRSKPGPVESMEAILVAYTGKAAHNIGGMTAHSAFSLLLSQNQGDHKPLAAETLNTLRVKLMNMKLLIIDEISMLGSKVFHAIHDRLCQVFQSTEPFGGKSVIVLGDFKQIRPVGDPYAFLPHPKKELAMIVGNVLWQKFKLFELTEIMRQKDDLQFAEALGRLSEGRLTIEDEEMFRKRCFKDHEALPEDAKKAIHLFARNIDVDAYNLKRVRELTKKGDIIIPFRAIDKIVGKLSEREKRQALHNLANKGTSDTYGLPETISLQEGVRYMVTNNINVADGLFNGATGVMKVIERTTMGPVAVWIDFDDASVGLNARADRKEIAEMHNARAENKILPSYTPIQRIQKVFMVSKKGYTQVCREQYPIVVAEGLTIHKSQGQSMNKVVVYLGNSLERTLLYVAASRATSLEGLYFIGKFKPPSPPGPKDQVVLEMERLKKYCLLHTKFEHFRKALNSGIRIISHNVQSLRKHINSIICDKVYTNSDLLLFQETWALSFEQYQIPEFTEIDRNHFNGRPTARGTMIFKRDTQMFVRPMQKIEHKSGEQHVEITSLQIENDLVVINVYKSPKATVSFFQEALLSLKSLFQVNNLLMCGDFNENFSSTSSTAKHLESHLKSEYGLTMLSPRISTTDESTTIDAVFGKLQSYNLNVSVYESIFSYHKPLIINLHKSNKNII